MYSRSWLITFLLLCPHIAQADLPKPTDRWKNLANRNRGNIIGPTPVTIPNLLPTLADDGIQSGSADITVSADGKSLLIDQHSTRLLGYWKDYNIAEGHSVRYVQPNSDSVAVNLIQQESPSLILGNLDCTASCWLINPNGVFFGEHARVNTRGLIAAAMEVNGLPMDPSLLTEEQLVQFSEESLFSSIENQQPFLVNAKDFVSNASDLPRILVSKEGDGDGEIVPRVVLRNGEFVYEAPVDGETLEPVEQELPRVLVKEGAQVNSVGAPILMAGPEVINEGTITSNTGQVVLAGSRKDLYLALTDQNSLDLRGYIVEVDSGPRDDGYTGAVINAGSITSNLGNVTLVAGEIVQAGKIQSTTAVDINGSVRLIARDRARVVTGGTTNEAAQEALYLDAWEMPDTVPVGTEGGDVLLTAGSEINVEIDKTVELGKFIRILNTDQVSSDDRNYLYRLLGVSNSAQLIESVEGGVIDLDFALELAISNKILKPSARFETMATAADGNARSTQVARATGGLGEKAQPISRVHIEGRHVTFEDGIDGEGSRIIVPSGDLTIRARSKPFTRSGNLDSLENNDAGSDASLYVGQGTTLDVSGTKDTVLSSQRNTMEFFITSNELRNSPLQKGGDLLRETVSVDIREGTPLFDWRVGFGTVERSANERSVTGGNIDILSSNSLQIAEDVLLDASGGKVKYEKGNIEATRLLSAGGVVDIANAKSEFVYFGIVNNNLTEIQDNKWGKINGFRPGPTSLTTLREAYNEGFDAGTITIRSPNQNIDSSADFNLQAFVGIQQLQGDKSDLFMPTAGDLNISTIANSANLGDDIIITRQPETGDALALSADLIERAGAADIRIISDGVIINDKNSNLIFDKGSNLSLEGAGVIVEGDIRSIGGTVNLEQKLPSRTESDIAGSLVISGEIHTSGAWWNQSLGQLSDNENRPIDAGDIRLVANDQLFINETSAFVANGGALLSPSGTLKTGAAGSIEFVANSGGSVPAELIVESVPEISAVDANGSGAFYLQAQNIEFSDSQTVIGTDSVISNDFFQDVLVGQFYFEALSGNIDALNGSDIVLEPKVFLIDPTKVALKENNSSLLSVAEIWTPPDYLAPSAKLSLTARRENLADQDVGMIRIANGAAITAAPDSAISFSAATAMEISGEILSPGGDIQLVLADVLQQPDSVTRPNNYIWIGSSGVLDVSSEVHYFPLDRVSGVKRARIVQGGNINISADYGHALIAEGAQILLRGQAFTTREPVWSSDGVSVRTVPQVAAAGSLFVGAEQTVNIQSRVDFGESSGGNRGGELVVELSPGRKERDPNESQGTKTPLEFILSADAEDDYFADFVFGDVLNDQVIGRGVLTQKNLANNNIDRLAINVDNNINADGDQLYYYTPVIVQDDVQIDALSSVIIDGANLDVGGNQLKVSAPHVQLGESASGESSKYALGNVAPIQSGDGWFLVESDLTDFYGNFGVNHAQQISIRSAQGVRLRSVSYVDPQSGLRNAEDPVSARNVFTTSGNIQLAAPSIYAESLTDYSFELVGENRLFEYGPYGQNASPVISALSNFKVTGADDIYIDSKIEMPFGAINLQAQRIVELGPNAVLDVSGQGISAPLGRISNGLSWTYPLSAPYARLEFDSVAGLGQLVENKSVSLNAPQVVAATGSTVDLQGGGDIYAREFIKGLGGDFDVLSEMAFSQGFAVLPSHSSGFSPFDPLEFYPTANRAETIPWGSKIEIQNSKTLAAGEYTVLPASYALLPGAYLLTPKSIPVEITSGYRAQDLNGFEVVAGRVFTEGAKSASKWSGYRLESSKDIAKRAEYRITSANQFDKFTQTSPGFLPKDNGRLNISVLELLDFNGQVTSDQQSDVGVSLDISAGNRDIRIVDQIDLELEGELQITQDLFTDIGADSILIGANRYWQNDSWNATPTSANIRFDEVEIKAAELTVVAQDTIEFSSAKITADAALRSGGNNWIIGSSGGGVGGALLVSSGTDSRLNIADGPRIGTITLDESSSLMSTGVFATAASFEGYGNVHFDESKNPEKILQIFADAIGIGESFVPGSLLAQADQIALNANQQLTFAESVDLDLKNLMFIAPDITVQADQNIKINASETIVLQSDTALLNSQLIPAGENSSVDLSADRILFQGRFQAGTAQAQLSAQSIELNARESILTSGDMALRTNANLDVVSPYLAPAGSSLFTLVSSAELNIKSVESETDSTTISGVSPSAIYHFESEKALTVDSAILAPAGNVSIHSKFDVSIGDKAEINVAPFKVMTPEGESLMSPAGSILISSDGDISIGDVSRFQFGVVGESVEGGKLVLDSGANLFLADVTLDTAFADNLSLDVRAANISEELVSQIAALNSLGFNDQLAVQARESDLELASGRFVAKDLSLISQESLIIGGDIQVKEGNSSLILEGSKSVKLTDTASITFESKNPHASVDLISKNGVLEVENGAVIRSSGDVNLILKNDNLVQGSESSSTISTQEIYTDGSLNAYLVFSTPLDGNLLSNQTLGASIETAIEFIDSNWLPEDPSSAWLEMFSGNLPEYVRPYIELSSATGIRVDDVQGVVDLSSYRTSLGESGILELRAGEGIDFRSGLSDGVTVAQLDSFINFGSFDEVSILKQDESWSFKIHSGLATTDPYLGSISLADGTFIRSGTGGIEISTPGNLQQKGRSYIGSFGKTNLAVDPSFAEFYGNETPLPVIGNREPFEYFFISPDFLSGIGHDSGDIRLDIGGDLLGNAKGWSGSAFMQRLATDREGIFSAEDPYSYAGIRAQLQAIDLVHSGVHSVGGGSVYVDVSGSISDFAFSTPGQFFRDLNDPISDVSVTGGDLSVSAFNNITKSSFFNSGGKVEVASQKSLGSESDGLHFQGSNLDVILTAGRDVVVEGIVNNLALPDYTGRRFSIAPVDVADSFFLDLNRSSIRAVSISGDVRYTPDVNGQQLFLPNADYGFNSALIDKRFLVMPSSVDFLALHGDLVLQEDMIIFPDPIANFNFFAAENIISRTELDEIIVTIPDIEGVDLPSIANPIPRNSWGGTSETGELRPDIILTNNLSRVGIGEPLAGMHSTNWIDRSLAPETILTALNGSIDASPFLIFRVPKSVTAYAGDSIVNSAFEIQHNKISDVSIVQAQNDIIFPFEPIYLGQDSRFEAQSARYIRIDGPGDFILMAGDSIDLGTIDGIRSIGASEVNKLETLSKTGANIHVYAGISEGADIQGLVGSKAISAAEIPLMQTLFENTEALQSATVSDIFHKYAQYLDSGIASGRFADYTDDYSSVALLTSAVAKATGVGYFTEYQDQEVWRGFGFDEQRQIARRALKLALDDWQSLSPNASSLLNTRIAVTAMANVALERPGLFTPKGQYLFKEPPIGRQGFGGTGIDAQQERSASFTQYWEETGQLLSLEYMLSPYRIDELQGLSGASSSEIAALPFDQQLAAAREAFRQLDGTRQVLVGEYVMNKHMRQSSREGVDQGNNLVNFARGYIAQRQFFGRDFNPTIEGMYRKVDSIEAGKINQIGSVQYGVSDGKKLSHLDEVISRWSADSGVSFEIAPAPQDGLANEGNISSILTTIQSNEAGGNITLLAPRGSVDVGISQSQIANIGLPRSAGDLGILAKGYGDINSVVASAFNVNEARAFTLAGGAVNLWSTFGDVDAGKGAKTILDTPLPNVSVSEENGRIAISRPPGVSGSGITTKESRSATTESMSAVERFYSVAEGAGPTYLSTPLGIVDAGEAGIQSAGDLFIAASKVVGADNISVGGASVGVVSDSTVGGDVAAASNSTNAATDSVQSAVADKAGSASEENVTTYVTVEILDTGTKRVRRDRPGTEESE